MHRYWPPGADRIREVDLSGLPTPVARYLRNTGVLDEFVPARVAITQRGRIRLSPTSRWRAVEAEQTFFANPPGFEWSARAKVAPLFTARVIDGYRDGHGSLDVFAPAGIRLSRGTGPDVDRGALLRFLAELVWMPAAMLAPYISWDDVGPYSASATITDHGLSERAVFHFGDDGFVTKISAMRFKDAGTPRAASLPWEAHVEQYTLRAGGALVPRRAEVMWHADGGSFGYFDAYVLAVSAGYRGRATLDKGAPRL